MLLLVKADGLMHCLVGSHLPSVITCFQACVCILGNAVIHVLQLLLVKLHTLHVVPDINITTWPLSPIQGAMVGSPQDIQCIVSTVSGVEWSSVMISWMGPGGESITNDSRVTISPTTSSGNNYTSSLQFTYLMEGDGGMYTCNAIILETSASAVFEIVKPTGKLPYL